MSNNEIELEMLNISLESTLDKIKSIEFNNFMEFKALDRKIKHYTRKLDKLNETADYENKDLELDNVQDIIDKAEFDTEMLANSTDRDIRRLKLDVLDIQESINSLK